MTVDPMLMRQLIDDLQVCALSAQRLVLTLRLQAVEASSVVHAVRRAIVDVRNMQPPPDEKDGAQ